MKKKKGFSGGFFQGMNLQARLLEASYLSMLAKFKAEEKYLDEGYENWADFCIGELGMSHDSIDRRLKALNAFGAEVTHTMMNLGFSWRDVRAIDHALTEDQRAQVKKGVLEIDGKKIQVKEENAADIQDAVKNLIDKASNSKKAEELADRKLKGIEREHKKELKAMQEENDSLKNLMPQGEDDAEWADKLINEIASQAQNYDRALRALAFHKRTITDPVIQAKIMGKFEEMQTRFKQFSADFDAYITEDTE